MPSWEDYHPDQAPPRSGHFDARLVRSSSIADRRVREESPLLVAAAARVSPGLAPKIMLPAVSTFAPASTLAAAVSALTPPST